MRLRHSRLLQAKRVLRAFWSPFVLARNATSLRYPGGQASIAFLSRFFPSICLLMACMSGLVGWCGRKTQGVS